MNEKETWLEYFIIPTNLNPTNLTWAANSLEPLLPFLPVSTMPNGRPHGTLRTWRLALRSRLSCQVIVGTVPLTVEIPRYTMNWVKALPGFDDAPARCGERILEAIQQAWIDEMDQVFDAKAHCESNCLK